MIKGKNKKISGNRDFGVILGTGVGGGFVFKGNLLRGPNSISGEWGHNPTHILNYFCLADNIRICLIFRL